MTRPRHWRFLAALVLAACVVIGLQGAAFPQAISCPTVKVPVELSRLVVFRPGPTRGQNDVRFVARFTDVVATCEVADDRVTVNMRLIIQLKRGPASLGHANFAYVVAVKDPRGQIPERPEIFPAEAQFGERKELRMFKEREQVILIPAGRTPSDYVIFAGFQLSQDQLRYNREAAAPPPED